MQFEFAVTTKCSDCWQGYCIVIAPTWHAVEIRYNTIGNNQRRFISPFLAAYLPPSLLLLSGKVKGTQDAQHGVWQNRLRQPFACRAIAEQKQLRRRGVVHGLSSMSQVKCVGSVKSLHFGLHERPLPYHRLPEYQKSSHGPECSTGHGNKIHLPLT